MHRTWLGLSAVGKIAAGLLFSAEPVLAAFCFFSPDLWLLYQLLVPSAQGVGPVYTSFSTEGSEVWLTIDDGPDESDTPRILDLLDRHRARATFFLIGMKAGRHPDLVREIERRGHEVGHHTHTHPQFSFWLASASRVRRELDLGLLAFARGGARPRRFRAPVGIKNLFLQAALAERGLANIAWNVRSFDCARRDPTAIAAYVLARVKPGGIVLMHEGPAVPEAARVEAIARLLEGLAARGYACVLPRANQLRLPTGGKVGGEERNSGDRAV